MIGKKVFLYVLLGFSLLAPVNSFALFGQGDVVTDPGAYSYFVEQIEKAEAQFQKMVEQVKVHTEVLSVAQKQYEEIIKVKMMLENTYNYAVRTVRKVVRIAEELEENPSAVLKYADKYLINNDAEGWADAEEMLDAVFKDPRKLKELDFPEFQKQALEEEITRYHIRQNLLRSALKKAEKTQADMGNRYRRIAELSEEAGKTENPKASQDLTNAILTEILAAIQDQTSLIAQLGEARAALSYNGIDEDATEEERQNLADNDKLKKDYLPMRDYLQEKGVNVNKSADDAMSGIMDKYLK